MPDTAAYRRMRLFRTEQAKFRHYWSCSGWLEESPQVCWASRLIDSKSLGLINMRETAESTAIGLQGTQQSEFAHKICLLNVLSLFTQMFLTIPC